jgi:CTP synthase
MIPHVTGEVKLRLRELATGSGADVVFVEIGGTVGDVENAYYIEAVRELAFEEGENSCCFVALTYIVEPHALGEQKSKPAQLNMQRLMAGGIQPHIIACRASKPVSRKVREKIAMYSNVPLKRVFSMHDLESVYLIPEALRGAGIDTTVMDYLGLESKATPEQQAAARDAWASYAQRFRTAATPVTIGITGKYTSLRDSYASIIQALEHAGTHWGAKVHIEWVDSTDLTEDDVATRLGAVHGVIVPGGFGVRGVEGKIVCVRYVRESRIPYLGLCYGFQIAVIEFARTVAGLEHAGSTEVDHDTAASGGGYPARAEEDRRAGRQHAAGRAGRAGHPGTMLARLHGGSRADPPALPSSLRGRSVVRGSARAGRDGLQRAGRRAPHHAGARTAHRVAPVLHGYPGPCGTHQPALAS